MSKFLAIDPSYSIGADFVNDTSTYNGRWRRITILKGNTSFAVLAAQNWTGNSIIGEGLPAGFTIEGVFTSFELNTGGAVIAYKV